jgi:hypothetical protein
MSKVTGEEAERRRVAAVRRHRLKAEENSPLAKRADWLLDVYNVASSAEQALHALWREFEIGPAEERQVDQFRIFRPLQLVRCISLAGETEQKPPLDPNAAAERTTKEIDKERGLVNE